MKIACSFRFLLSCAVEVMGGNEVVCAPDFDWLVRSAAVERTALVVHDKQVRKDEAKP